MIHDIEHNIKQPTTWKRGGLIILFSIFYQAAAAVLFLIITFQFVHKLITGDTNGQLRQLSRSIGSYIYQILQFMSFNSNFEPYPFGEWPENEIELPKKPVADKATVKDESQVIQRDGDADGD